MNIAKAGPPPPDELNPLVALYNGRRYAELETRANALIGRYPDSGFAWKLLGASLQMQGKDVLHAFQKTALLLPGDADAHNNLGNALKDRQQFTDAVASFRRALGINPNSAFAHYNLGNVLNELGQFDVAVSSYRSAVKIKPDFAEAHNNLGLTLRNLGQLDAALESCRQAVKIKPDLAEAHNNLGKVFKDLGQLDASAASYRRELTLRPDSPEAHYRLGNVLMDAGQLEAAVTSYRRAVELKPDFNDAHNNLGNALQELGQFEHAAACYRQILALNPYSAAAYSALGHTLRILGQFESALANFRRALEIDSKCVGAMLGLLYYYSVKGDIDRTDELYREILEVDSDNLAARILLASTRKTKTDDENLAVLLAAENAARNGRSPIPNSQLIPLHFALGKCFDDLGEHDNAFPHFQAGCKLKRATFQYDTAQMTQHFDNVIRVFDQTNLERLHDAGNPSKVPIFVLGMPRSGTTLIEQIIASHPEVYGAGELSDMSSIALRDVSGTSGFPGNIAALDKPGLTKWGSDYVFALRQHAPDARHVTDKMPGNFFFVGLIHLMLPNAKIIHVNRNPVDTCLSCFSNLFNKAQRFSYDLTELGRYYVDYARLMEHWRNVLPAGAFLDVQYEDIVADQETQARRMIDFCDLEWDDACIEFHKNKRSVSTASMAQVRRPIYKSSMERWRPYEQYLGTLLDALGDLAPKRS